jgi:putative addiction module component (TIGR02574 family)
MSTAIEDFKQLPVSERIQIVEDLWDTIANDSPAIGLTPSHIEELDRRLDALEALPEAGTPWNITRERILASL